MESIRSIQEIVDEHKGEMPTGVVTVVMEACQKAYNSQPKLYKLTWTMVESHAHVVEVQHEPDFARVQLAHKTQTFIVEAVNERPDAPYGAKMNAHEMPNHGLVLKSWIERPMPCVYMGNMREDILVVIHSIVPYEPYKRVREE